MILRFEQRAWASSTVSGSGSDTSPCATSWLVLALLLFTDFDTGNRRSGETGNRGAPIHRFSKAPFPGKTTPSGPSGMSPPRSSTARWPALLAGMGPAKTSCLQSCRVSLNAMTQPTPSTQRTPHAACRTQQTQSTPCGRCQGCVTGRRPRCQAPVLEPLTSFGQKAGSLPCTYLQK